MIETDWTKERKRFVREQTKKGQNKWIKSNQTKVLMKIKNTNINNILEDNNN